MNDEFKDLRDKDTAIKYFKEQNIITNKRINKQLQTTLFKDMISRIKDQTSPKIKKGNHEFYYKLLKYKQYPIHYRDDEIILDQNELAQGSDTLVVASIKTNNNLLGYTYNRDGTDSFTLIIKDMDTQKTLLKKENITGEFEFFNDEILYVKANESLRPYQVWKIHENKETLIYEEPKETAFVGIDKSKDKQHLYIYSLTKDTTEVHLYTNKLQLIRKREENHEYYVEHYKNKLIYLSNKDYEDFAIYNENWELLHRAKKGKIENMEVFKNHIVLQEMHEVDHIRIISENQDYFIPIPEFPYELEQATHHDYNTDFIYISYSTPIHPTKTYTYNFNEQKLTLIHQTKYNNFNPEDYELKREYINNIPVTLCYKKEHSKTMWLTGYGSYGATYPLNFSNPLITLLNEGVVYAIAHIRGGGELGRKWYEDGKFLNKHNTFDDFITVAKHYKDYKLIATGRSAGGLLMGAVVNKEPELFNVVIADVPFVDVVNTMLDDTLPLTTAEYEEWGNPNEKKYLDYIKTYSPYDNVEEKPYPTMLITTGLNDTRVPYWEPAKWHAKLNKYSTSNNLILLKANLEAGHFGNTSRDEAYKEVCFEFAFALDNVK